MQELQQSRDAQDRELGRLRNEAMALVASTTSLEQQSQESVARLAHRADAAEMRAQELVSGGGGGHPGGEEEGRDALPLPSHPSHPLPLTLSLSGDAAYLKASTLKSSQLEREGLASRLEALGIQAAADAAALRQQLDVAMDARTSLSRELAAARQEHR